jgi:hypothetical protein
VVEVEDMARARGMWMIPQPRRAGTPDLAQENSLFPAFGRARSRQGVNRRIRP